MSELKIFEQTDAPSRYGIWGHRVGGEFILEKNTGGTWKRLSLNNKEIEDIKSSLKIKNTVNTVEDLPTSNVEVGSSYVVGTGENLDLYFCVGTKEDGSPIWKSDPELEDYQANWNSLEGEKGYIKNRPFGETQYGYKTLDKDCADADIMYTSGTVDKFYCNEYIKDTKVSSSSPFYSKDDEYIIHACKKFFTEKVSHNNLVDYKSDITCPAPYSIVTERFDSSGNKSFYAYGTDEEYHNYIGVLDYTNYKPEDSESSPTITPYIELDSTKIENVHAVKYIKNQDTLYATGKGNYLAVITNASKESPSTEYILLSENFGNYYYFDVIDKDNFICSAYGGNCIVRQSGENYSIYVWRTAFVKYIDNIPYISGQTYGNSDLGSNYNYFFAKWNNEEHKFDVIVNTTKDSNLRFPILTFGKIEYSGIYYAFMCVQNKIYYSFDGWQTFKSGGTSSSSISYTSSYDISTVLNKSVILVAKRISLGETCHITSIEITKNGDEININTIFDDGFEQYTYGYIQNVKDDKIELFTAAQSSARLKNSSLCVINTTIATNKSFIHGSRYLINRLYFPNGNVTSKRLKTVVECISYPDLQSAIKFKKPKNYNCVDNQKEGTIIISENLMYIQGATYWGYEGFLRLGDPYSLLTQKEFSALENTTNKKTSIEAQTESTVTYPTEKAVVDYVAKAVNEGAADDITSDIEGKMAFEHTTYLFSSHSEEGVATPPNLEEGPWFKNGVQAGTNNVYVDERDYAIVLEDETRCYSYYNNNKYQRIKDGGDSLSGYVKVADSQKSWIHCQPFDLTQVANGARPAYMFFKDNKNAEQIIFITLSDRKIYIYKNVQYVEGYDAIDTKPFIDETPSIAEAFPCQIKFVDGAIQATLVTSTDQNPDLLLKYPTTKYVCTVAQTASNPPTWQYQLTYNDVSFSQEEYAAIKSTITKTKVDSYDEHIEDDDIHVSGNDRINWDGKQDKLEHIYEEGASLKGDISEMDFTESNVPFGIRAHDVIYFVANRFNFSSGNVSANDVPIVTNYKTKDDAIKISGYYDLETINSLSIDEIIEIGPVMPEISGKFTVGTVFTLPTSDSHNHAIKWNGDTDLEAGAEYVFSIVGGIGLILKIE